MKEKFLLRKKCSWRKSVKKSKISPKEKIVHEGKKNFFFKKRATEES